MNPLDLINRMAEAEANFRAGEFLAPVVRGGIVFVRIAGVICQFRVRGAKPGWGIFRANGTFADFLRPATLSERQRYLKLFPRQPMVLVAHDGHDWWAWPAHQGDRRFGPPTLVPLRLVEQAQRFDRVFARFDGVQRWFDTMDEGADASTAAYLRELFNTTTDAEPARPRLTAEERTAYQAAVALRAEAQRDRNEERLRDALAHAGAEYRGHVEQERTYQIEFTVDGVRHVSVINKHDFGVQLAGICLNGADQHFDLASLVGVLREAEGVLRIGDANAGLEEDQYWAIHPPVR